MLKCVIACEKCVKCAKVCVNYVKMCVNRVIAYELSQSVCELF